MKHTSIWRFYSLLAATLLLLPSKAIAGCPPGYKETAHWVEGAGDNQVDFWKCVWAGERAAKAALQQLKNMGRGYVDTTTGFDGGQGMSSAVATGPSGEPGQVDFSVVTTEDLRNFAKDPAYSDAVATHDLAKEDLKKAEATMADLEKRQAQAKTSLERQEIQIAIANASPTLVAAKGAERIASNNVIKEVYRLKPEVIRKSPQKPKNK